MSLLNFPRSCVGFCVPKSRCGRCVPGLAMANRWSWGLGLHGYFCGWTRCPIIKFDNETSKHSPWQTASSLLSRRFLCKQWCVTALPFIFGNRTRRVTRRVALMKAELQAAGGVVAWCIFVVGIASWSQVWSLNQSYSVGFSQSRVSVKYGVHLIKVWKSSIWNLTAVS